MGVAKFNYFGETKFDITGTTASAETVLDGEIFFDSNGDEQTGTCTYDADTSDATATADEILNTRIAYSKGNKLVGRMPNNANWSATIATKNQKVTVPQGYHDGSTYVELNATEKSKLTPENIAEGITLFGVVGTHHAGTDEVKQTKTVTPTKEAQTFTPDSGYTCFAQFTVNAIPYQETTVSGVTTITIG